jgi:hypothetical protein
MTPGLNIDGQKLEFIYHAVITLLKITTHFQSKDWVCVVSPLQSFFVHSFVSPSKHVANNLVINISM